MQVHCHTRDIRSNSAFSDGCRLAAGLHARAGEADWDLVPIYETKVASFPSRAGIFPRMPRPMHGKKVECRDPLRAPHPERKGL